MLIEEFNQLGEVGKRPCQAIDLVDHNNVDQAFPDILHQALQGGALESTP